MIDYFFAVKAVDINATDSPILVIKFILDKNLFPSHGGYRHEIRYYGVEGKPWKQLWNIEGRIEEEGSTRDFINEIFNKYSSDIDINTSPFPCDVLERDFDKPKLSFKCSCLDNCHYFDY